MDLLQILGKPSHPICHDFTHSTCFFYPGGFFESPFHLAGTKGATSAQQCTGVCTPTESH